MSTRAHIGYINKDKSIDVIYCHNDGYGLLDTLLESYDDDEKISELISKGGMSSLNSDIENIEFYKDKEEMLEILHFNSFEKYADYVKNDCFIEYIYVFNNNDNKFFSGNWSVYTNFH